jgi:hypothetical protein
MEVTDLISHFARLQATLHDEKRRQRVAQALAEHTIPTTAEIARNVERVSSSYAASTPATTTDRHPDAPASTSAIHAAISAAYDHQENR